MPETKPSLGNRAQADWWNFRTRAQLEQLIERTGDDPRAAYYIINNAYHRHMALFAAQSYLRRSQRGLHPRRQAIAAYACQIATGSFSIKMGRSYPQEWREVSSYGGFVYGMLDEVLETEGNSPDVLLLVAATRAIAHRPQSPPSKIFSSLVELLQRAQALDPRWADLYYWEGLAHYFQQRNSDRSTPALQRAFRAIAAAESRDANLRPSCVRVQALITQDSGPLQQALRLIDEWLRLEPGAASLSHIQMWRRNVVNALARKQGNMPPLSPRP